MKFHFPHFFKKPDHRVEIVTACAGLSVLIFVIIEAICKEAAGPRPSLSDGAALVSYMSTSASWILGVVIADTFVIAAMTVFLAGLLLLAYRRTKRITMAMVAAALFAIIYATITLFGDSFDAGTALNAVQSVGDANVIRTLIEAHIIVFGPVGGIVLAFLAGAFGIVIIESRLVARPVAVAAFVVAALNIIAIPAVFDVYREWNNQIALVALVSCVVWVVVTSVALVAPLVTKKRI